MISRRLISILIVFSLFNTVWAADDAGAESKVELTGTRRQIATIIFAGLAGGILGLSTLSFYGRPQDHLSNIAIGFAVGVIVGTGYTTFKAATRPYEAYDQGAMNDLPPIDSTSRENMASIGRTGDPFADHPIAGWNWTF